MECSRNQIVFQPFEGHECLTVVSSFCDLLFSSIGPEGRLKILVTSGGYSIVTSSSTRILKNVPLCNPICLFISQVIKSQLLEYKDFGLYTGILASSMLASSLTLKNISSRVSNSLVQHLLSQYAAHLDSIKMQVDFSTVKQLFPFVKSIILSKPACRLSLSEANELTLAIVRAFLNSVNEDFVEDVVVICGEGSEMKNSVYSGVLYQTIEEYVPQMMQEINRKTHIPIILFNIMLSTEKNTNPNNVDRASLDVDARREFNVAKALAVITCAVEIGVKVVACQKVVHPDLSLYLRRSNVLLLERMGTELTRSVETLSGAVPISNLDACQGEERLVPLLGHVDSVSQIKRYNKTYLSLERKDKSITTMVVCGINEEASEELKITTSQALRSLRHLLSEPHVLPGAGCMEMSLIANLEASSSLPKGNLHAPPSQLLPCLRLLQMSLLKAAGFQGASLATLSTDTAFHHAWTSVAPNARCQCGLVSSRMVQAQGKRWRNLDLNAARLLGGCDPPKRVALEMGDGDVILDLFAGKRNGIKLAVECYAALMEIGMVVHKSPE